MEQGHEQRIVEVLWATRAQGFGSFCILNMSLFLFVYISDGASVLVLLVVLWIVWLLFDVFIVPDLDKSSSFFLFLKLLIVYQSSYHYQWQWVGLFAFLIAS